ncbi:MAG: hypothetical protein K0Q80_2312 [Microvirga sp.]|jgi:hypothetical protein|nr:hypothetical protein [Microvirga sp.]
MVRSGVHGREVKRPWRRCFVSVAEADRNQEYILQQFTQPKGAWRRERNLCLAKDGSCFVLARKASPSSAKGPANDGVSSWR